MMTPSPIVATTFALLVAHLLHRIIKSLKQFRVGALIFS
jgi:hypothetical protein